MNVRLDKYLAGLGLVSRRHVGKFSGTDAILVDGQEVSKTDIKVSYGQTITFLGQEIVVKENVYVLLHKSAWFVCSELHEGWHLSYKNELTDCPYANMLHAAGRLDQDTEWLLLCSSDGKFTHTIISPKKHLEKEYFVRTRDVITDAALQQLSVGVTLDDWYHTMPAKATRIDDNSLSLVLIEGKYHQVKRMLEAVGNEVTYLRRDRIGKWTLEGIELGKWKYMDPKE